MRFSTICVTALLLHCGVSAEESSCKGLESPPFINPKLMIHGEIKSSFDGVEKTPLVDVHGCCTSALSGDECNESSNNASTLSFTQPIIGKMPQLSTEQTLQIMKDAETAWDGGSGVWPQLPLRERLDAIERLLKDLETNQREKMVQVLMWEIGKNRKDAESEFDRTLKFSRDAMQVIRGINTNADDDDVTNEFAGSWQTHGSTMAFVRRAAVGK
jgi:acyl-CoA reductase-like NAD-dependent aldehyde dehydrogenase